MEKRYYGQYRGLVIQNNDPEFRGRVKVFVPQVNAALYEEWNALAADGVDTKGLSYTFLGNNVDSKLMPVLQRLKEKLPWSDVAQPIVGASSSGVFNAPMERASIADSSEEMTGVKDQCLTEEAQAAQAASNKKKSETENDSVKDTAATSEGGDTTFVPMFPRTAYSESGVYTHPNDPHGVGAISSIKEYGTYQMPAGTAMGSFLAYSGNPWGAALQTAVAIGVGAFDAMWRQNATDSNREFGLAQERFYRSQVWEDKTRRFENLSGVNLSTKSSTLSDVVVGTIHQYGDLSDGMARYIRKSGGQILTSNQIGLLLQRYKAENVANHFPNESALTRSSITNRIANERGNFDGADSELVDNEMSDAVERAEEPPVDVVKGKTPARPGGNAVSASEKKGSPQVPAPPVTDTDACGSTAGEAFNKKPVVDAMAEQGTEDANNNRANPFAHLYRAAPYTNKAKGSFSIPAVGSHVWVFFEEGDPQYPVIWSAIFGKEDVAGIWDAQDDLLSDETSEKLKSALAILDDVYGSEKGQGSSPDYPSNFENRSPEDGDNKDEEEDAVYRSKWVVNQRGGSIELVSTYERERVRFTHHNGSMIDMNKLCMSRLATENDQTMVLKDQFETIRGNKTVHVDKDWDQIVYGDVFVKQGDMRRWKPHSDKMKDLMKPLHDKKRLFDRARAIKNDDEDQAPGQKQIGDHFVKCPVCSDEKAFVTIVDSVEGKLVDDEELMCEESGSGCNGRFSRKLVQGKDIIEAVAGQGSGTMFEEPCWSCGGSGKSPSTQDGTWPEDEIKKTIVDDIVNLTDELSEHEKHMGQVKHREGGNLFELTSKNRHVLVGLTFNDFTSYRRDDDGKLVPYGYKIERGGVYPEYAKSPLVESVHVDNFPGGDYDITACHRFGVNAGSGGARIRTTGGLDVFGALVKIGGESVSLTSRSDVTVDAGSRFDVEADIIALRPRIIERTTHAGFVKKTQQVGIFGNLNVGKNIVCRGGAHFEGEVTLHHITAPLEWHQTNVEPKITKASMLEGKIIGRLVKLIHEADGAGGMKLKSAEVESVCSPDCIEVDPHVHWNMGPPMTLVPSHAGVRDAGARCNELAVVAPHPIVSVVSGDKEVMPKGSSPYEGGCSVPSRWQGWEGPEGNDKLLVPDPDLDGNGDGTSVTNTESTRQRAKKIDERVEELRKEAESLHKNF